MENILQAFRDLAKFKIVASIDTGDKTYDNLIVLFVMAIFAVVFSSDSMKNMYLAFTAYYYKDLKNLEVAEYLSAKLEKCSYELIPVKKEIIVKLIMHLKDNCCHLYKNDRICLDDFGKLTVIDNDTMQYAISRLGQGSAYVHVRKLLDKKICPIFISKFGAVGIKGVLSGSASFLYFSYESRRALDEFMKILDKISYNEEDGDKNLPTSQPSLQIGLYYFDQKDNIDRSGLHPIYPDRSFDKIVSKYKPTLLSHLKGFQDANNGKTMFNGFGNYNLGIMVYGLPGTGKTSVMKAICNYLGRDGHVFDMRTVRTTSQFKRMFHEVDKRVYIFDEFDCIRGVINRENGEEFENNHENCKKELRDRLLSLLAIQHTESKDTQNVTKEIENVKKELKQLDEMLNLETMLTVLDGPCEMRNRVIVASTNYIDRIDPALLRPGRFDVKIRLEEFNDEETIELLEKMFAGDDYLEYIKNHKFKRLTPTNIINICHELRDLRKIVKAIEQAR